MSKRINKDIDSIIKKLKQAAKPEKPTTMSDSLNKALVHPMFRERDMRKEAVDMGAYEATEFWGEGSAKVK